jgi:hypothetical protein
MMFEPAYLPLIVFLLVMLIVYLWASRRSLIKNKALTPNEYLWKLKQITNRSEYELFHIAAQAKGWPAYQVEGHFRRYLEDQKLPVYVIEFIEDGKKYIDTYQPKGGDFFNKKVLIFYSIFTVVLIGGSLFISLYIIPNYFHYRFLISPKSARPHINRAISYGLNGQHEKACDQMRQACDLGYCEFYKMKKINGYCL